MYERRVITKSEFHYMRVSLDVQNPAKALPVELTNVYFKQAVTAALTRLFGDIGGAMVAVDVLKYNEGDRSAILRVHSHNLVKLWSALTLTDRYMSRKCAFRVHQVSPYLMGLAVNSREYEHT
ncbi:PREDICTED: ribonuclease P protein subunit p14-like isoform X2 [Priapulus caudatus]|uniref:Ribonuclease P protein subunit p14-like isoform X1 n=1 Tax=Priapulus caudatus TaxID=37621 RepID=A0ABM1F4S3_PRICU|nr:PREDICTED: ribonuclease P protein subunit p14-like isoform X1 [Priapulus caudatus]XP_014679444.1 PREDICTED: ribonuclease P protein subunit p14-like isoform X2 [Priapulus caudatus]